LKTFAYLSTGESIDNPRFFREEEKALAKAQRRLSKAAVAGLFDGEGSIVIRRPTRRKLARLVVIAQTADLP
jgi:hypothetical protein